MKATWKRVTYVCWDCDHESWTWLGRIVHGLIRHQAWVTNAYYERQYHQLHDSFGPTSKDAE